MIAKVFLDGKDVFTLSSTGKRLIFRLVPLVAELSYCSLTCQEFFGQGACPFPKTFYWRLSKRLISIIFYVYINVFIIFIVLTFLIRTWRSFYESC